MDIMNKQLVGKHVKILNKISTSMDYIDIEGTIEEVNENGFWLFMHYNQKRIWLSWILVILVEVSDELS